MDAYSSNQEALGAALQGSEYSKVYDYDPNCEEISDDMKECIYNQEEAKEAERVRQRARIDQLEQELQEK